MILIEDIKQKSYLQQFSEAQNEYNNFNAYGNSKNVIYGKQKAEDFLRRSKTVNEGMQMFGFTR